MLPFASLSLDPANEFFAEGIHDELLNQLAQIGGLNVMSRTSVLRYADTIKPNYGRIGDADAALRNFDHFRTLATGYRVGDTTWALAYLGVGNVDAALERLRAAADGAYDDGLFLEFGRNVYQDPLLETPEFAKVRERLRFRD